MLEKFQNLFEALFKESRKDANSKMIAKHLAKVLLWELKGNDTLYPDVKDKCLALIKRMSEIRMPIQIIETFRTASKQDIIYNQIPKVTNARGLESFHQFGLAFDCNFIGLGYNASSNFWDILGKEGEKLGLEWGGRFPSPDRGHFQWTANGKINWTDLKPYFEIK